MNLNYNRLDDVKLNRGIKIWKLYGFRENRPKSDLLKEGDEKSGLVTRRSWVRVPLERLNFSKFSRPLSVLAIITDVTPRMVPGMVLKYSSHTCVRIHRHEKDDNVRPITPIGSVLLVNLNTTNEKNDFLQ